MRKAFFVSVWAAIGGVLIAVTTLWQVSGLLKSELEDGARAALAQVAPHLRRGVETRLHADRSRLVAIANRRDGRNGLPAGAFGNFSAVGFVADGAGGSPTEVEWVEKGPEFDRSLFPSDLEQTLFRALPSDRIGRFESSLLRFSDGLGGPVWALAVSLRRDPTLAEPVRGLPSVAVASSHSPNSDRGAARSVIVGIYARPPLAEYGREVTRAGVHLAIVDDLGVAALHSTESAQGQPIAKDPVLKVLAGRLDVASDETVSGERREREWFVNAEPISATNLTSFVWTKNAATTLFRGPFLFSLAKQLAAGALLVLSLTLVFVSRLYRRSELQNSASDEAVTHEDVPENSQVWGDQPARPVAALNRPPALSLVSATGGDEEEFVSTSLVASAAPLFSSPAPLSPPPMHRSTAPIAVGVPALVKGLVEAIREPVLDALGHLQLGKIDLSPQQDAGLVPEKSGKLRSHISNVETDLRKVRNVVDELAAFATEGHAPHHGDHCELAPVVERALTLKGRELGEEGIEIKVGCDEGLNVAMRGELLIDLVNEVVDNARIGMKGRGERKLSITAQRNGDMATLRIQDSGSGMTREMSERATDPFVRGFEFGRGSGLGLTRVLSIIRGHGGHLRIDSAVGEGTTLEIQVPLFSEQIRSASAATRSNNSSLTNVAPMARRVRSPRRELLS